VAEGESVPDRRNPRSTTMSWKHPSLRPRCLLLGLGAQPCDNGKAAGVPHRPLQSLISWPIIVSSCGPPAAVGSASGPRHTMLAASCLWPVRWASTQLLVTCEVDNVPPDAYRSERRHARGRGRRKAQVLAVDQLIGPITARRYRCARFGSHSRTLSGSPSELRRSLCRTRRTTQRGGAHRRGRLRDEPVPLVVPPGPTAEHEGRRSRRAP